MPEHSINIYINATNNASKALGDTATGLGKISTAAPSASKGLIDIAGGLQRIAEFAIGNLLSAGIQKIGGAIAGAAQEALTAYSNFERLGMSLESLVAKEVQNSGGAKSMADAMKLAAPQAKELLNWTQKLAIESPLTQAGVANAFRTAMAYGYTTKEAKKLTETMVDFTAATGKGEDTLGLVAYALGQIRGSDKLLTQDLRQLMNAGIDVNGILAKMGYKLSDVGKTAIDSKKFLAEFSLVMERDFGGAAKKQAGTFSGLLSSMSDIKEVGLREFFAGTFQAIQPLVQNFVDIFSSGAFMETLRNLGEGLGGSLSKIMTPLSNVVGLFGKLMQLREGAKAKGARGREAKQELLGFDMQAELQKAVPFLDAAQSGAIVEAAKGNLGPIFTELGKAISEAWTTYVVPMFSTITGADVGGIMSPLIAGLQGWILDNQDQVHGVIQAIIQAMTTAVISLVELAGKILAALFTAITDPGNKQRAMEIGMVIGDALITGVVNAFRAKLTPNVLMPEGMPGTAGGTTSPWANLGSLKGAMPEPNWAYGGGGQHGGSFVVPPGFSNDRFLIGASSGERVDVTPAGATYNNQRTSVNLQVTDTLAAAYIMDQMRRGRMNRLAGVGAM